MRFPTELWINAFSFKERDQWRQLLRGIFESFQRAGMVVWRPFAALPTGVTYDPIDLKSDRKYHYRALIPGSVETASEFYVERRPHHSQRALSKDARLRERSPDALLRESSRGEIAGPFPLRMAMYAALMPNPPSLKRSVALPLPTIDPNRKPLFPSPEWMPDFPSFPGVPGLPEFPTYPGRRVPITISSDGSVIGARYRREEELVIAV